MNLDLFVDAFKKALKIHKVQHTLDIKASLAEVERVEAAERAFRRKAEKRGMVRRDGTISTEDFFQLMDENQKVTGH